MKKNAYIEEVEQNMNDGQEIFSVLLKIPLTKKEYVEFLGKTEHHSIDVEF